MTPHSPADALATAAASLLDEHDLAGLLLQLVQDAATFTGCDAGGLLVQTESGLEVLTATSHAATHLELYQALRAEGPCLDVLDTRAPVHAAGADELVQRWPTVGPAVVEAGFEAVHATPLFWRNDVVGGLNLFARAPLTLDESRQHIARAFADMATLAIAQPESPSRQDVVRGMAHALGARVVIEQAKGALAQELELDMAAAYDELLDRSKRHGTSLTATARDVLWQAQRP
jgi:GAF domain-containing protein